MDPPATTEPIRLLLIDYHVLFRESLSRILAAETGFEVVGQHPHAPAAVEALKQSTVDVVLLEEARTERRERHRQRQERALPVAEAAGARFAPAQRRARSAGRTPLAPARFVQVSP